MGTRREEYGVGVDQKKFLNHFETIDEIPPDATVLRFRRRADSHRGISRFQKLTALLAFCVNQDFLDELTLLPSLTTLCIEGLTAADLQPLDRCVNLRRLMIMGGTRVPSLDWVTRLPQLDALLIQNFKLVTDISPLTSLQAVRALGIEGSMWTAQRVETLEPLKALPGVKALFLTNCRIHHGGLRPLHDIKSLEYLESASFPGDAEFLALRRALPHLQCAWFGAIDKYGSIRKAIKARLK